MQRWEEDWQVSPGFAGKMGHICFTYRVPSAMVNDKLLPIPLVLLLSAYQFYPFLLTNLHIWNWAGDIPATLGSPWLEKPYIMGSPWMHTKDITSDGKGLFSVVCGYVHRDKGHRQEHLCGSGDLPTRDSHTGLFVLWNTLGHSHRIQQKPSKDVPAQTLSFLLM